MNTLPLLSTEIYEPFAAAADPSSKTTGRWLNVVPHLDFKYGGVSATVPQLSSKITAVGKIAVSLAAFCTPDEVFSGADYPDITITEWPAGRRAWFRDRSLETQFDRLIEGKDGMHIHGLWEQSTFIACRAARRHKVPYIMSAHGMLDPWALANKQLKKKIYSLLIERANVTGANCLHALTFAEAEDYRRYGATQPIAIIPNGIDAPEDIDTELFFSRHPTLREKRIILFLGRIHFKKGLDLLVQAWRDIIRQHPNTHLVLAGPDSEGTQAEVVKLIERDALGKSILLTGMLRDQMKWSALASAECYVLPSYSEGFSVSTLEAMAIGLPVIISDRCNLPEVARAGAGWVVAANASALARAFTEMLDNSPQVNQAIGTQGKQLVQERYNWTEISKQMSEIYTWIQGGATPQNVIVLESGGPR